MAAELATNMTNVTAEAVSTMTDIVSFLSEPDTKKTVEVSQLLKDNAVGMLNLCP